jgi:hypothetical protein
VGVIAFSNIETPRARGTEPDSPGQSSLHCRHSGMLVDVVERVFGKSAMSTYRLVRGLLVVHLSTRTSRKPGYRSRTDRVSDTQPGRRGEVLNWRNHNPYDSRLYQNLTDKPCHLATFFVHVKRSADLDIVPHPRTNRCQMDSKS